MRLDRATVLRGLRAAMLLGLAWELLVTLQYPGHKNEPAEAMWAPSWHSGSRSRSPVYSSTALLRRCQTVMEYNTSSKAYDTGRMSLWRSTDSMFLAEPAAAWATWQELIMTAKNPWAVYWASKVVPESWHIMPGFMRENLELFDAAVPVLYPDPSSTEGQSDKPPIGHNTAAGDAEAAAASDGDGFDDQIMVELLNLYSSHWVAHCSSPVNETSLKPLDVAYCTVTQRSNTSRIGGTFQLQLDAAADTRAGGKGTAQQEQPGFAVGPAAAPWYRLAAVLKQKYRPAAVAFKVLGLVWMFAVPTGSLRQLQQLLGQLSVLELEWQWEVLVVYMIVLLVAFRNWLHLVCVAYKVSRRLALLAFHRPLDRLIGTCLTFLGMFIGLWQAMGYAVLDVVIDVALVKLQVHLLGQSPWASAWVWYLSFEWGVFEMRGLVRTWKLAKLAWGDVKGLVLHPQVIMAQHGRAFAKPPPQQVNVVGTWPQPLPIPDEVDDLPVSEVPRGFICPITQAIMRQPALLLHDGTIAPSTYDKEAIQQWLSEHSSDPKNPGTQLVMKTVKLVYNGDLARAIEDWVAATAAAQRDSQQRSQLAFVEQRLAGMRAQARMWQQQVQQRQQQQQPAPGGTFHFGQQQQQQQHGPAGMEGASPSNDLAAAGAAAAGADVGVGEGEGGGLFAAAVDAAGEAAGPAGAGAGVGAAVGGAAAGFTMADAGQLMRQSSVALAQVASMDIPHAAVASLASLADTTCRITTRAAARRLRQQQLQEEQQQQQQQEAGGDSGSSSSSEESGAEAAGAGTSSAAAAAAAAAAGEGGMPRRSPRVRYRARR